MSNTNHSRLSNLLFRQVHLHRTRLVHQLTRIQHNLPQQSLRAATTFRKHRQGLTVSAAGARALGPHPAPPPGAGTANLYYQSHSQPAPRGYGTPPPGAYPPPAPYHTRPQGTLNAPNYPAPHAPGWYSGQGTMASFFHPRQTLTVIRVDRAFGCSHCKRVRITKNAHQRGEWN